MTITAYLLAKQSGLLLRPCLTPAKTNIDPTKQVIKGPLHSTKLTEFLQQTNLFEGAEIIEGSHNRIAIVSMSLFTKATHEPAAISTIDPAACLPSDHTVMAAESILGLKDHNQEPTPVVSFGAKSTGPGIPGWDLPALPKKPVVESKSDKFNLWGKFDVD